MDHRPAFSSVWAHLQFSGRIMADRKRLRRADADGKKGGSDSEVEILNEPGFKAPAP